MCWWVEPMGVLIAHSPVFWLLPGSKPVSTVGSGVHTPLPFPCGEACKGDQWREAKSNDVAPCLSQRLHASRLLA